MTCPWCQAGLPDGRHRATAHYTVSAAASNAGAELVVEGWPLVTVECQAMVEWFDEETTR